VQAHAAAQAEQIAALQAGMQELQQEKGEATARRACIEATLQQLQASAARHQHCDPCLQHAGPAPGTKVSTRQAGRFSAMLQPLARAAKWLVQLAP
jgi:hypothetical protein